MALPPASTAWGRFVTWVSAIFKSHELLIVVVLAVGLAWGITGKVQSIIAAHDEKVFNASNAQLQATASNNALLAQSNATLAQQAQQANAQLSAANTQLSQANAQLSKALAQQKATDATLPPTALAARMQSLAGAPDGSVKAQPDNTISLTQPAAVAVTQTLEEVPVVQQQLANTQQEKANVDKLLVVETALADGRGDEITGLKLQQVQSDKVCDARVQVEKDKAAKAKRKAYIVGGVIGAVLEGIAKHFI